MGNFLGNLGAAFRGQQDYSEFEQKQEEAKLRIQAEKARLAEIQEIQATNSAQRKRQPDVDRYALDYLGQFERGIPPPPPSAPNDPQSPNAVQPPSPGQASVPMLHPGMQSMQGMPPPPGQMPPGMQPRPMGPPPVMDGMQGGPMQRQMGPPPDMPQQMPPQGSPQGPPSGPGMQAPPIPPYQTVGGAMPPQMAQQGIPRPPQQGQAAPPPNSMSIQDAARFIKSKGVTDPTTAMQVLEKLNPYLNNEAKQELAVLKMHQTHDEKIEALKEKAREADQRSKDSRYSTTEQAAWHAEAIKAHLELGRIMASIAQQRVTNQKAQADKGDGSDRLTPAGMAVQEELARAGKAIPKGKRGEINYKLLNSLGEHQEGGAGSGSLVGGMADYKTAQSTYSQVQKRTAGIELGVKKLEKDIKLLESTMAEGNAGFATVLNKPLNYLRTKGSDPKLAAYALAASNVAVEFERLRTGGMLSAAQLHAGAQEDAKKIVNGDMSVEETLAVIPVMMQEIENGREAAKEVEKFYRDKLHSVKEEKGAKNVPVFSTKAEVEAAKKSGKVQKGDTFNDPNGNPHTVN